MNFCRYRSTDARLVAEVAELAELAVAANGPVHLRQNRVW